MSKERLPEGSGWKDRLLEPEALPEWTAADKEAVWDRLHARLGKRARRSGAAWYRIAAAILLCMVGMSVFFRERSTTPQTAHTPGSGTKSVAAQPDPSRAMALTSPGETYPTLQTRPPVFTGHLLHGDKNGDKPIPGRSRSGGHRLSRTPIYSFDSARFFSTIDSPRVPVLYFTPDPAQIARANGINPLAPVARKELRVISVNELDHPSGPGSSMAGGSAPKRLGFRWNNHGSPGTATPEEQSGQDRSSTNTLIKINLSPQN